MIEQYSIPPFLEQAFDDKFSYTDSDGNSYHFYVKDIGNLKVSTGKIIACDPFTYNDDKPFSQRFPIGKFPIELAIAKINDDERVGFARIRFSDSNAVKWTMAVTELQNPAELKAGEIFGYGVDAGTGAFMDTPGGEKLSAFMSEKFENYELLISDMDKTYTDTWSWLVWGDEEVAMFSSGWGDGFYATYIGYDEKGNVCRLVTDFGVIFTEE